MSKSSPERKAQLNLAVVCSYQYTARLGDEHFSDFAAQLCTNRDVLEVGVGGAQATGGSDHVLEGGVNPPVGANDL